MLPCDKQYPITFPYGVLYPINLQHLTLDHKHHGIDYGTPVGSVIYSPCNCVLSEKGQKEYFGNYAIFKFWRLEGLGKSTYRYIVMHLDRNLLTRVRIGQSVSEDQVIGLSGESGSAEGHPHLHFEAQKLDKGAWKHCDPSFLIGKY